MGKATEEKGKQQLNRQVKSLNVWNQLNKKKKRTKKKEERTKERKKEWENDDTIDIVDVNCCTLLLVRPRNIFGQRVK